MTDKIRWGILGTGVIAGKFAEGLQALPDAVIAAVGSRSIESADAFGDRFAISHRHSSYEALIKDPEVDVIYVATPHPMHFENAAMALEAGKAVLCEKPITLNAEDTAALAEVAKKCDGFLMEAMWTRFLPAVIQAKEWLDEGAIGDLRMVRACFGFRAELEESHRLLNPALGGGSLLDVGVYPIALAHWLFGAAPSEAMGLATKGATGVDEQAAYVLQFPGGGLAWLASAVLTETPQDATLMGTEGMIHIETPFWAATTVRLEKPGEAIVRKELPHLGNGYSHEAAHVMDCLRQGLKESPVMPLRDSIAIMETCDNLRKRWGIRYPGE